MRRVIVGLLFSLLLLRAETNTVDTSSFDIGFIMPFDINYISVKDGGSSYMINYLGAGLYLEYDMFALHLYGGAGWHQVNSQDIDDMMDGYYGFSLLYNLNNRIELGTYYNKYVSVSTTNEAEAENNFDGGEMYSYGIRMVYNPNNSNKKANLNFTLSLGYFDASDIISYQKHREYSNVTDTRKVDLSGYMFSIGVLRRFNF